MAVASRSAGAGPWPEDQSCDDLPRCGRIGGDALDSARTETKVAVQHEQHRGDQPAETCGATEPPQPRVRMRPWEAEPEQHQRGVARHEVHARADEMTSGV